MNLDSDALAGTSEQAEFQKTVVQTERLLPAVCDALVSEHITDLFSRATEAQTCDGSRHCHTRKEADGRGRHSIFSSALIRKCISGARLSEFPQLWSFISA